MWGKVQTYRSIDAVNHRCENQRDEAVQLEKYLEYLNSLKFPGYSVNKYKLKIGSIGDLRLITVMEGDNK